MPTPAAISGIIESRAALRLANQGMKPTSVNPFASASSVENQTSTFHPAALPRMSFHVTTPVSSISEITMRDTVTAATKADPKIQPANATVARIAIVISRRDTGPIRPSSVAAHPATREPLVIDGGYTR